MKSIKLLTFLYAASLASLSAGGEGWTHDYEAARKQALAENKDILIDFTGSDWCPPCQLLTARILSKEEFRTLTKDRFVLLELDFPKEPKTAAKQSEPERTLNKKLTGDYGIQGFPTVVLTDAEGRPYAYTGFTEDGPAGPAAYVANLEKLRERRVSMNRLIEKAENLSGVEKARSLGQAIEEVPEPARLAFYQDLIAQIKKADPKDESGFFKRVEDRKKIEQFSADLERFQMTDDEEGALAYVEKAIAEGGYEGENKLKVMVAKAGILASRQKFDEALEVLNKAIVEGHYQGEAKLNALAEKAQILAFQKKFDEAVKVLEEAKAAAPDSKLIPMVEGFQAKLAEEQKKASGATLLR